MSRHFQTLRYFQLHNFRQRDFLKLKNPNNGILKKPTEFFLGGIKTKLDEGVGRILLGDNTGRLGVHAAAN